MPLAIGGGTYARDSKNSIAFGAAFSKRDYRMHGDDEYFPLSDFYDNMQIYAHAIHDLSIYLREGKVDFSK
jgi:succinyl-diaminopimelate desuccinylase